MAKRPHMIPSLMAALPLLFIFVVGVLNALAYGSFPRFPSSESEILRITSWVVFLAAFFVAYHQFSFEVIRRQWVGWVFVIIGALFNPFFPYYQDVNTHPFLFDPSFSEGVFMYGFMGISGIAFLIVAFIPTVRKKPDG